MNKIILTNEEKRVIEKLGDSMYTVEYVEEWINEDVTVGTNALGALNKAEV